MLILIDEPGIRWFEPDFRLLYVGGDHDFLVALKSALQRPAYLVIACPDKDSANLLLKSDIPYDLFLFGLEVWNRFGLELVQLARSLSHREHLPIIAVTANEGTIVRERSTSRAGANECVWITRDTVLREIMKRGRGIRRKKRDKFNSLRYGHARRLWMRTGADGRC